MLIGGTGEGKGRYTTVLSGANTSKFVAPMLGASHPVLGQTDRV